MRAPLSGCSAAYSSPQGHQAGHLVLGQLDLLAAELGEREVGDLVVGRSGGGGGHRPPWWFGGVLVRRRRRGEQALVLLLLPAQPVARLDALGAGAGASSQRVGRLAHPRLVAQPLGERDVREAAVEPGQQLAQGAQALQLARSEDAVARGRARRLDQPDALDVAEHSRRPAGGLGRLVDRQAVGHPRPTLARLCQGLPGDGPASCGQEPVAPWRRGSRLEEHEGQKVAQVHGGPAPPRAAALRCPRRSVDGVAPGGSRRAPCWSSRQGTPAPRRAAARASICCGPAPRDRVVAPRTITGHRPPRSRASVGLGAGRCARPPLPASR